MKIDALKQYARLRQQLLEEKSQLETRLNEINQVLGSETTPYGTATTTAAAQPETPAPVAGRGKRGGRRGNAMSMREAVLQVLSKGPLSRKELVGAVQGIGYVFTTKNPANSLGSVLYAKNVPIKNNEGKFYLAEGAAQWAGGSYNGNGLKADAPPTRKKKGKMSPKGKANIAAAQKVRRERERAGK